MTGPPALVAARCYSDRSPCTIAGDGMRSYLGEQTGVAIVASWAVRGRSPRRGTASPRPVLVGSISGTASNSRRASGTCTPAAATGTTSSTCTLCQPFLPRAAVAADFPWPASGDSGLPTFLVRPQA